MSKITRITSLLLCCVMLLTYLPVTSGAEEVEVTRYSVLILDTSGSMAGIPASKQKDAAIKFCKSVLEANGTNYVAIVNLNTNSSVGCNFTDKIDDLINYVNTIPATGGTNINQALQVAGQLLDSVPSTEPNVIKNIILCSDGLPEHGATTTDGPYTSSDYSGYRYANYCYNTAEVLKKATIFIHQVSFIVYLTHT